MKSYPYFVFAPFMLYTSYSLLYRNIIASMDRQRHQGIITLVLHWYYSGSSVCIGTMEAILLNWIPRLRILLFWKIDRRYFL